VVRLGESESNNNGLGKGEGDGEVEGEPVHYLVLDCHRRKHDVPHRSMDIDQLLE
jgi:hypothetical protein